MIHVLWTVSRLFQLKTTEMALCHLIVHVLSKFVCYLYFVHSYMICLSLVKLIHFWATIYTNAQQ